MAEPEVEEGRIIVHKWNGPTAHLDLTGYVVLVPPANGEPGASIFGPFEAPEDAVQWLVDLGGIPPGRTITIQPVALSRNDMQLFDEKE